MFYLYLSGTFVTLPENTKGFSMMNQEWSLPRSKSTKRRLMVMVKVSP